MVSFKMFCVTHPPPLPPPPPRWLAGIDFDPRCPDTTARLTVAGQCLSAVRSSLWEWCGAELQLVTPAVVQRDEGKKNGYSLLNPQGNMIFCVLNQRDNIAISNVILRSFRAGDSDIALLVHLAPLPLILLEFIATEGPRQENCQSKPPWHA